MSPRAFPFLLVANTQQHLLSEMYNILNKSNQVTSQAKGQWEEDLKYEMSQE